MAAKLICRQPKFSHITPLLIELHWLPVEQRIQFKVLTLTFKGLYKLAPAYISNLFVVKPNKYSHRSSTSIQDISFVNGEVIDDIQMGDRIEKIVIVIDILSNIYAIQARGPTSDLILFGYLTDFRL